METTFLVNKSEIGAGTRGASLGIDAMLLASLNKGSKFFENRQLEGIKDRNDLLFKELKYSTAKRIEGIAEVFENISDKVNQVINNKSFPIVLAADHASAGGTIAGIKKAYPEKRLGVIWVDAHGDLHSPYTSPTGNVHGMPLATALNEDNLECKIKEVEPKALEYWNKLKNTGVSGAKVLAEDIVFFGVRDTELPEDEIIKRSNIKNYTVTECREIGILNAAEAALEKLSNCDIIYISFDVDSMDCEEVSLGTGTPVKNGFTVEETKKLLLALVETEKLVSFELVEVNPILDNKTNKMAETAFDILEAVTNKIEEK